LAFDRYRLCAYIAQALASDLFRVPLVIETKTTAFCGGGCSCVGLHPEADCAP
jgi:hypothetical protein